MNWGLKLVQEHFELVKRLDIPWSIFEKSFASGYEGMRKPDLCFFEHVVKETGFDASQTIMIDDTVENICAARSRGMHGILVDKSLPNVSVVLRNLLLDPLQRAQSFLTANAGKHHCLVEGYQDVVLKDNFAQFMIWELTGDDEIIYLKWPYGRLHGVHPAENGVTNGHAIGHTNGYTNGHTNGQTNQANGRPTGNGQTNGHTNGQTNGNASGHASGKVNTPSSDKAFDASDVNNGLWNYFFEAPVLTTKQFPPDADTTSTAYLSLPQQWLSTVPNAELVMEKMAANVDSHGIMQTYFDAERPRVTPEVCCNILRVFYRFGRGGDPRTQATVDYVVECLNNNACLHGNRHYSTPESFLYFVARLYVESKDPSLQKRLGAIRAQLQDRLNVPVNPLALALRLFACQCVGVDAQLYKKDLEKLVSLQDEDGGWPAGHFCCIGRTGARIGNRGLTAALALRILQHEKLSA